MDDQVFEQKNGLRCMIKAGLRRKLKRGKFCQSIAHGSAYHCTDCAPLLKKSCQVMSRATDGPCV